ncbi:MAG TPA: DUF3300 domain-containing protein [Candidatus Acidoferrales bacterium]|nr:DUF3300 domain-containing protein [Candidatus Acidoferrales bacterium]
MRKALALVLASSLVFVPLAIAAPARAFSSPAPSAQDQSSYQPYTDDQLDNLLAPIALYPDPLLAQVLVAATFADQIDEAARYIRSYGQDGVDDQPWDVSVRAVAHYPAVLNMMDDNLDWTTAVGQAYVYQSTDVMLSIQRLRAMAESQGNLVNSAQQQVVDENGYIYIWPANPEYIYVPSYDPSIVFFRPVYSGGFFTAFSFGPALVIGVWLNLDCDWGQHRVYYTGWRGSGWIARSRPHIRMNPAYVDSRFSNIVINRNVAQRQVNYIGLDRYRGVHRDVDFENRGRGQPAPQPRGRVPNKIIDRNINPHQQLDEFRGRQQPTPPQPTYPARPVPQQPRPAPPPQRMPEQPRTFPQAPQPAPTPTQPTYPARPVPQQPRPAPPPQRMPEQPRTFPQVRQPMPAPAQRPPSPPAARPPNAFGRGDSSFDTGAASQRGQQSRQQMNQRPAPSRPAPPSHERPPHPGGR